MGKRLKSVLLIAALVVFLISTAIWIRSAVQETNELPLDHH